METEEINWPEKPSGMTADQCMRALAANIVMSGEGLWHLRKKYADTVYKYIKEGI